jgi:hypothetical protein
MSSASRALEKEHDHTMTSKKTMNSKRTVVVAEGRANCVCTARRRTPREGGVAGDDRRRKRHVRSGGTRQECNGGRRQCVRYQTQGQLDSHSRRRHTRYEAKTAARLQKVGVWRDATSGAQPNRTMERTPRARGSNVSTTACQHGTRSVSPHRKWRSRNMA